jgi:nitrate reductase NapE component
MDERDRAEMIGFLVATIMWWTVFAVLAIGHFHLFE